MRSLLSLALLSGAAVTSHAGEVTFAEHIAPMVYDKCASCHRPGQVGPFPLLTYEDVSKRARTIEGVIESRYMPPWKAEPGHVEYADSRRLTDAQIEAFSAWVKAGKPKGDMSKAPKLPSFPNGWQLGEPDLVISMKDAFEVPADGPDVYRSFVLPLRLPEDKWVKAVELKSTATGAMHHAIFFLDSTGQARKRDGEDGKPGFRGMVVPSGGLGGYVPGTTPTPLPEDLAMRLPANSDVVMQTHFHPSGKAEKEQAKMALYFADKEPSRNLVGVQVPAAFGRFKIGTIKAGDAEHVVTDSYKIPVDVKAWRVGGHAHYICKEMKMSAELPSGKELVLMNITDWDLDWQDDYTFKEAIDLPAGTVLKTRLVYDNSADNPENPHSPPKNVRFGRQSNDEMGSVTLIVTAKESGDERTLRRSALFNASPLGGSRSLLDGRGAEKEPEQPRGRNLNPTQVMRALDRNRDGKLDEGEIPERLKRLVPFIDADKNGEITAEELEAAQKRFRR